LTSQRNISRPQAPDATSPMAAELKIICGNEPSAADRNAGKIAQFLGVPFSFDAPGTNGAGGEPRETSQGQKTVAVASWTALKERSGAGKKIVDLLDGVEALFVYGWEESAASNAFLAELTDGTARRAKANRQPAHRIGVAAGSEDVCRQWTGLDFDIDSGPAGVGFELAGANAALRILISRDGEPFFVQLTVAGAQVLLAGCDKIADLGTPISKGRSTLEEFEGLVPLMMFLRRYFGDRCWQAPEMRASFIIDDPLLRPRYGYLDYQELLESMQRLHYAACIAFIPWNYRRTDRRIAALFAAHPECLSICVHGCDHTAREFCGSDEQRLRDLTRKALWRMDQHERLYGLGFAPVMVFPQGWFSTRAMQVLGQSRFLAAVNSSPYPVDLAGNSLTLEDFLAPAFTSFSSLPLFTRRYPRNLAECVLDLFVGKPLLLVEHHGYFQDGCKAMESFIAKINALAPRLEWTDLDTVCSRACLRKLGAGGEWQVRFYTDRFSLANTSSRTESYALLRRVQEGDRFVSATVNGRRAEVLVEGGQLKIPLTLEPSGRAQIVLERKPVDVQWGGSQQGPLARTRVFLRRSMSEFRDNVLDKNPLARRAAMRTLGWLRSSNETTTIRRRTDFPPT
jgi:hypothetical protein